DPRARRTAGPTLSERHLSCVGDRPMATVARVDAVSRNIGVRHRCEHLVDLDNPRPVLGRDIADPAIETACEERRRLALEDDCGERRARARWIAAPLQERIVLSPEKNLCFVGIT